jgi:hypothetical protein
MALISDACKYFWGTLSFCPGYLISRIMAGVGCT